MPCIYETINLKNKKDGVNPYRYIGSDQHDKSWYFGSNKSLRYDIKNIGKEFFEKVILMEFDDISNIELRKIESETQVNLNCANDITYYNKTNHALKGYTLTEEEKIEKSNQLRRAWKEWVDNGGVNGGYLPKYNPHNIDNWIQKYGNDIGKIKFSEFKNKISILKKGENNPMNKYSDDIKEESLDLFFKKSMSRNDICKKTGISYGILKLIIRNYKMYGIISTI